MSAVALAVSGAIGPIGPIDGQSEVSVVHSQVVQVACDDQSCRPAVDVTNEVQAITDSLHRFMTDLVPTATPKAPWLSARWVGLRIVLMHF